MYFFLIIIIIKQASFENDSDRNEQGFDIHQLQFDQRTEVFYNNGVFRTSRREDGFRLTKNERKKIDYRNCLRFKEEQQKKLKKRVINNWKNPFSNCRT